MNAKGLRFFQSETIASAAPVSALSDEAALTESITHELRKGTGCSVVHLTELLLQAASVERASDVHLDPSAEGTIVRLRVDGLLHDAHLVPAHLHVGVVARIKILSGLRTDLHLAAQDGRFRAQVTEQATDVRVSIVPTHHGEAVVLRLLSDRAEEFTLERLGFTMDSSEKILGALRMPHGMILATGPVGSGKTTTLYTLMKLLNRRDVSIITIEDPIEYAITGVNQIEVNARSGLTFVSGLRSILRQDPNIIMVGEIRDEETAAISVNTALTGHLVLSTLHTGDAPTALPRLLDMHAEPYLVASTVTMVIGQRLVRRLCEDCKTERSCTEAAMERLRALVPRECFDTPRRFWTGKGCAACNGTGYRGRAGIYETLEIDASVRDAVLRKASVSELRALAIERGMVPMIVDGFEKVSQGTTTIEEVLRTNYE